jgi:hypothetical protein
MQRSDVNPVATLLPRNILPWFFLSTGTPTPATQSSDLAHLKPLLMFLRHDPYGQPGRLWEVRC